MKYITFSPPGEMPFVVLFSPHVSHDKIAKALAQQVIGAGFVTIPATAAFPGGFSTSLRAGVGKFDKDIIEAGLLATANMYPTPPTTPAVSRQPVSANLNDVVRFKLTDKGRAYVEELNRNHSVYSLFPLNLKTDAEGWIEMPLWEFSNIFGRTFGMGFDGTVETSVQLRSTI